MEISKLKINTNHSGFGVAFVTAYLLLVAFWLIVTRQLEAPPLGRIISNKLRKRYVGNVTKIQPEHGFCWICDVPGFLLSDKESASSLIILEDGKQLGPGHSGHDEIRSIGQGRFSHWGAQIYFSTSDNSDPQANGRMYTVEERRG
jgi:hypothetical protein